MEIAFPWRTWRASGIGSWTHLSYNALSFSYWVYGPWTVVLLAHTSSIFVGSLSCLFFSNSSLIFVRIAEKDTIFTINLSGLKKHTDYMLVWDKYKLCWITRLQVVVILWTSSYLNFYRTIVDDQVTPLFHVTRLKRWWLNWSSHPPCMTNDL